MIVWYTGGPFTLALGCSIKYLHLSWKLFPLFQVFAEVKKNGGNPFNVYFSSYLIFCNFSSISEVKLVWNDWVYIAAEP